MNPCPRGQLGNAGRTCRCTPDAVLRYQGRISDPLLDRIDLQIEVPASLPARRRGRRRSERRGRGARRRSAPSRDRSPGRRQRRARHRRLAAAEAHFLAAVTTRLSWSARGFHRILRVARTVADLDASAAIPSSHLGKAIQYRRALGTVACASRDAGAIVRSAS
jgi:magnesium chelatase family protein